jgi:hypothetical protein
MIEIILRGASIAYGRNYVSHRYPNVAAERGKLRSFSGGGNLAKSLHSGAPPLVTLVAVARLCGSPKPGPAARRLHRRHAGITGQMPWTAGPFLAGSNYCANCIPTLR